MFSEKIGHNKILSQAIFFPCLPLPTLIRKGAYQSLLTDYWYALHKGMTRHWGTSDYIAPSCQLRAVPLAFARQKRVWEPNGQPWDPVFSQM